MVRFGPLRSVKAVMVVMVRQLRLVNVCFGMVSCGMAVMVSHGRCGTFRYGVAVTVC